jgi:hypothetical protein
MASGHNDMKQGGENSWYIKYIINNSKMQRIVIQYSKSAGLYQIAADAKVGLKMPDPASWLQASWTHCPAPVSTMATGRGIRY